jgi:hypothetical protein
LELCIVAPFLSGLIVGRHVGAWRRLTVVCERSEPDGVFQSVTEMLNGASRRSIDIASRPPCVANSRPDNGASVRQRRVRPEKVDDCA